MSELSDELNRLRRGRGVLAGDIGEQIGQVLRERAGIGESNQPQEIRDRLVSYLTGLAQTLPEDLGLVFSAGLALHPEARFRFLAQRVDWVAARLDRDPRTIRRRFDEAVQLLEEEGRTACASDLPKALTGNHLIDYQIEYHYRLLTLQAGSDVRIGYITGDIRRVKCADVWVNPENTHMKMARFEEHSVSAVIRYEGAGKDAAGQVTADHIAQEIAVRMAGQSQVVPGVALTTGSGELSASNNVRHIVHVAAVHGEPGEGYRQVHDVGRCVTIALAEVERLGESDPTVQTVLIPLLGAGTGNADAESTVRTLLGAAMDFLSTGQSIIRKVLFLAYDERDLTACTAAFTTNLHLAAAPEAPRHQP